MQISKFIVVFKSIIVCKKHTMILGVEAVLISVIKMWFNTIKNSEITIFVPREIVFILFLSFKTRTFSGSKIKMHLGKQLL